jgi:hypothetical protein
MVKTFPVVCREVVGTLGHIKQFVLIPELWATVNAYVIAHHCSI